MNLKHYSKLNKLSVNIILLLMGIISIFPILWIVSTSLKEGGSIFNYPPSFIPRPVTFDGYINLITKSDFPKWFFNSTLVTTVALGLNIFFSSMAGFAFSKTLFPGKKIIFIVILSTLMIPGFALFIPLFNLIVKWGLVNTYWALILPQAASPVGIFIIKQYCDTLPDELIDAAKIDGANIYTVFMKVCIPLLTPALTAAAIFSFLGTWNSFFWPLIATTSSALRTLPVGLAMFQGQYAGSWTLTSAASFLSMLPALILYLALQKYFVQGIAMSGMKG
jgi:ABC-type glycerol-3-phosphate transport system permease component